MFSCKESISFQINDFDIQLNCFAWTRYGERWWVLKIGMNCSINSFFSKYCQKPLSCSLYIEWWYYRKHDLTQNISIKHYVGSLLFGEWVAVNESSCEITLSMNFLLVSLPTIKSVGGRNDHQRNKANMIWNLSLALCRCVSIFFLAPFF
jgi:hypothetical protein